MKIKKLSRRRLISALATENAMNVEHITPTQKSSVRVIGNWINEQYKRTRVFCLASAQAGWDTEGRQAKSLPVLYT